MLIIKRKVQAPAPQMSADQKTSDPSADANASPEGIKSKLALRGSRHGGHRELKSRRRELRLTPSADDLIKRAMEVSGLTAGDLAYEAARKLLEFHNANERSVRAPKRSTRRV